jgi:hypothetical protein
MKYYSDDVFIGFTIDCNCECKILRNKKSQQLGFATIMINDSVACLNKQRIIDMITGLQYMLCEQLPCISGHANEKDMNYPGQKDTYYNDDFSEKPCPICHTYICECK